IKHFLSNKKADNYKKIVAEMISAIIKKHFEGKGIRHIFGEYCWSTVRDTKPESYKRQIKRPRFL
ncbi:hypothetical protein ALC56_05469, partial [Trachymyrmex septentrionalis]